MRRSATIALVAVVAAAGLTYWLVAARPHDISGEPLAVDLFTRFPELNDLHKASGMKLVNWVDGRTYYLRAPDPIELNIFEMPDRGRQQAILQEIKSFLERHQPGRVHVTFAIYKKVFATRSYYAEILSDAWVPD